MGYDVISSLPSYQSNQKGKDYCRSVVFLTIKKLGICTDKQISEHLNWPINRVTPRRGELVEKELVIQFKKDADPVSKRLVSFWSIKPINHAKTLFE